MPIESEVQYLKVPMPTLGLLTNIPGLFIDKRYSPAMDNIRIYAGEVLNRPGTVFLPSASQTLDNIPTGGMHQKTVAGAVYSVMATKTKWYAYDTGTTLWVDRTGGASFNGTDNDLWDFAVVHGKLIGSNGHNTDKCYEWVDPAGGNITQLTNSFGARYVEAFADRIFLHHTTETGATIGDRVRWNASGSGQHNVWDPASDATAGFIDLVDTPGVITGARPLFGSHYVFKRDYIHKITETGLTTPSFSVQTVVDGIGCIEGRTIVEIAGMLYFMGREDVYRWDTASRPEPIGTKIRNELFDQLGRDEVRKAIGFHHELFNEYWLVIPDSTATWANRVYMFNYIEGSWTRAMFEATCHTPFQVVDSSPSIDSLGNAIDSYVTPFDSALSGADVLFPVVGREDKKPVQIDDTSISDADGSIPLASFDTADTLFGPTEKHVSATANRVILTVRGRAAAAITVELSVNGGKAWTNLGTQTTLSDSSVHHLYYPCRVTGQQGRLRVTTSDAFAYLGHAFELIQRAEAH